MAFAHETRNVQNILQDFKSHHGAQVDNVKADQVLAEKRGER